MRMLNSKQQIHSVKYRVFPLVYLKEELAKQKVILHQYSLLRYKYPTYFLFNTELNRSDIAAVAIECLEKHLV